MRAILPFAIVALVFAAPWGDSARADNQPGKVNVTVVGPDKKPAKSPSVIQEEVGVERDENGNKTNTAGKGKVIIVHSFDLLGDEYHTAIYVPDGVEIDMTTTLGPKISPYGGYEKAVDAKESGDTEGYAEGYDQLKHSVTEFERIANETQTAIDEWAKANEIPKLTLKQVNKQLQAAETVGANQNKEAVEKLKAYKAKLERLETIRESLKEYKGWLASLDPPEKKTTMAPGTCPEGQSGGLLAGLLNSATGTNSFSGICDDKERQKDNKKRDPERHEREHKD